MFGISIDPVEANREMVEKLFLPFSLLSDPQGEVIRQYGVWDPKVTDYGILDAQHAMARPAIIVVGSDGIVSYAYVGNDFADRPGDDPVYAALSGERGGAR